MLAVFEIIIEINFFLSWCLFSSYWGSCAALVEDYPSHSFLLSQLKNSCKIIIINSSPDPSSPIMWPQPPQLNVLPFGINIWQFEPVPDIKTMPPKK